MRTMLFAALLLGTAWAMPAGAQLPGAADAKDKVAQAQADQATGAAEAQKAAGSVEATGAATAEETKAATKTKAGKKAREVKGKAKAKADTKATKAGALQPAAEGAVKTGDEKAEEKIEAVTK